MAKTFKAFSLIITKEADGTRSVSIQRQIGSSDHAAFTLGGIVNYVVVPSKTLATIESEIEAQIKSEEGIA